MAVNKFIIDVETTGIDPSRHHILSVGILAIDDAFNAVAQYEIDIHCEEASLIALCDAHVTNMHKTSGLWQRCIDSNTMAALAQKDILEFIEHYRTTKKKVTLINNNPHFDMMWLKEKMPMVADLFNYRLIDVSTINEMAEIYHPELANRVKSNKTYQHTAVSDCYETLGELRLYINEFFNKKI